ncbi:response regulator transcription factor [Rhizobium sp. RU36D]|uniref:winged helix-turn-helix transcriptional regulator n=1 Tax=Rhizobium sp. RU36D TaxID=1907415 RepID=UPI0009D80637|nr:response regulator transcription factor [Rhizobium sp. RU36D]SMD20145.1 two-component system, OmpR family, phosphate regulon response regulator PhoB [Rhizobium sp. RU36D]
MNKILVCVSDVQLFLMLRHIAAGEGFEAVQIADPDEMSLVRATEVIAIVLDWSLRAFEKYDFLDVAKAEMPDAAVILLCRTAIADETHIPPSDLLLQRPFDPACLLQFLRGLRKKNPVDSQAEMAPAVLQFGDLALDLAALTVRKAGREVHLTALQFRLLRRLMQKPTTVVDREDLIASCWPEDVEVEPRTVDIHIAHIRRALRTDGTDMIRTVRGCGYALQLPHPAAGPASR